MMGDSIYFPYPPYGRVSKKVQSSDFLFDFDPLVSPMEEGSSTRAPRILKKF